MREGQFPKLEEGKNIRRDASHDNKAKRRKSKVVGKIEEAKEEEDED